MVMKSRLSSILVALVSISSSPCVAQNLSPAQQRAGYAMPWTMRPAVAPTLVRVESSIAARRDGVAAATIATGGVAIIPTRLGVYARLAVTHSILRTGDARTDSIPTGAFANPALFVLFTPEVARGVRIGASALVALPLGNGSGNTPSPLSASSLSAAVATRSAMDGALFATNYLAAAAGGSVALIRSGVTAQLEATLVTFARVRGELARSASDPTRVALTAAASVGYLVHPALSLSFEAHYQRWLYAPALMAAPNAFADQLSFELGARANIPLSRTTLLRPGFSFGLGVDGAMSSSETRVFHFDLPVLF